MTKTLTSLVYRRGRSLSPSVPPWCATAIRTGLAIIHVTADRYNKGCHCYTLLLHPEHRMKQQGARM
jgi:hypothetical protein